MRTFINGVELPLVEFHEYALGPLRIHARDDLAKAYNRTVKAYVEAKISFEEAHGYSCSAMEYLDMRVDPSDLKVYESFGFAIAEAIEAYDGPPISGEKLDQAFLLRV